MSLNGSGVYSANTSGQPVQNGETVDPDVFNALITDIATALSTAVFKDGQQTITANLPMSNYILTGLGSGLANRGYSARIGDIQDSTATFVAGGGTADAITATFVPAITAVVDGMELCVRATAANATTTPTFSPNGLTARTIKKQGGQALVAGDIRDAGHELRLRYVAATTHWELLNPTYPTTTGLAATGSANTFTADQTITSTDAGAAVGPKLILDRDSASPAVSDVLGAIDFVGEDSGGADETYARIQAEILDPTAATEDGTISFYAVTAGSLASRRLRVGPGLIVGSPTGGDQGGGTVNATGYYVNGSLMVPAGLVLLNTLTASGSASLDFTSEITATYDEYELHIEDIVCATTTAGTYLAIEVYVGGAWKTSGYCAICAFAVAAGISYHEPTARVPLTDATYTRDTAISARITFTNPNSTAQLCKFFGQSAFKYTPGPNSVVCSVSGFYNTAGAAVTQIRVIASAGNLTSGKARLYGVRKS